LRQRPQEAELRRAKRDLFAGRIREAVAAEIEAVALELDGRLRGLLLGFGRQRLADADKQTRLV
jgi:hypothetical protein